MTEEEKRILTNDLLSNVPAYGEFEIFNQYERYQGSDCGGDSDLSIRMNSLEQWKNTQVVIQELISSGFMVNRHDIKVESKVFRQLTDKGRLLKELGSMDAFNLHVQKDIDRKHIQDQRLARMYWINFCIAVATGCAAIYYLLEILRIQYHWGLPHHVFFQ